MMRTVAHDVNDAHTHVRGLADGDGIALDGIALDGIALDGLLRLLRVVSVEVE